MTTSDAEARDQFLARKRFESWANALYRPIARAAKLNVATIAIASLLGLIVALVTRQILWTIATTAAVATLGWLASWAWLRSAGARAAIEVLNDHNCRELAEWKTATGTSLPRTVRDSRRWLREHPDSPGRATVLARVGQLAEARAVIDAATPATPEDAFGLAILRKSLDVLSGDHPDVSGLHAEWSSLPDTRERFHRRECLALLDAQIAIQAGGDPWSVLASARGEVGEVHSSQRAWKFVARIALANVLAVITVILVASIVIG